jgi:hypothetical protein
VEAASSSRGLWRFTTKLLGSLVQPQSQDRRLGGRRRDPGALRDFEAEDRRQDRKACVEGSEVWSSGFRPMVLR